MAGGRPLKFETVQELQDKIDDYFKVTPAEEYAITGLAVHLGTDRTTLINYEGRPEFFDTVKDAKTRIELAYEKRLIKRGNAGDIFALKNFDWRDKQELDHTTAGDKIGMISPIQAKSILDAIDTNSTTD